MAAPVTPRQLAAPYRGVSIEEALQVPAVYRSVNTVATLVSSLTIDAVRNGQPLKTQPALVRKPNLDCSRRAFVYDTVMSMALHGEFFWYHPRTNILEVPSNVAVLAPLDVQVYMDDNGIVQYRRNTFAGWVEVPRLHITHEKLTRLPGLRGRGPIQTAPLVIWGALKLEEFVGMWWDENQIPEGLLSTDQDISPDQARRWSDEWMKARRENRTAVLGKGLRYEVIEIDPQKALYTEATKLKTVQIAQLFGIPAAILDAPSGDSQTYANVQQRHQALRDYTLRSYLDPIEGAWGELLPTGTFARFRTDELLRMDEAARATFYSQASGNQPWLLVDEIRDREGLPPINQETSVDGGSNV
ncbi:phage portal protein [Actinoplanes oblitus]|uniref:Phage portal protein n=1 Tax=Actinoplanes oblitus TaxID=3040509 RepID=A0ABY8WPL0_9ACTN|nr:phage portal protein [Actinoplanes oblitus]WIM99397.1 phage portal protein [Actinoplanes oblitus]